MSRAMNENELKPCPFCGNKNPMIMDERRVGMGFQVVCRGCAAKVGGEKTERGAVKSWNRRTEQ